MPRPNVLLIFTDQQRWDTIAAAGNLTIRTPNLDRLANEGVLFDSGYTPSPVCVSARCSLVFGQYPHNTDCYDNGFPFPDDRPTFMETLAKDGYRTHGIGKMHFAPDALAMRGFDSREIQEELRANVDDSGYVNFLHANGFDHIYDPFGQRGEMYYIPQVAQMPARYHGTNWVGDRSVDFIENADSSQPFCLFTSFIHPHPPFTPPTPWNKLYRAALMSMPKVPHDSDSLWTFANHVQNRYKYRDQGIDNNLLRTIKAYYYACISFVDFQVGRIIESLEKTGQLDNTIIAFTSDHGELLGDYNCFGKRSMLDSAARVPMIVRHPERIEAGRKCSTPVNLVDIYPTFLAATGSGLPPHRLVGTDMAEIADGADEGRTVYSQFQTGALGVHMACDRNWKYFYSAPDRREFLFDRTTDPDELRDRAGMVLRDRQLAVMRERVIARYMEEGHADAVDGDFFQEFEQPQMPTNPDAGLLIQDPYWSVPLQEIPGYTDPVD